MEVSIDAKARHYKKEDTDDEIQSDEYPFVVFVDGPLKNDFDAMSENRIEHRNRAEGPEPIKNEARRTLIECEIVVFDSCHDVGADEQHRVDLDEGQRDLNYD